MNLLELKSYKLTTRNKRRKRVGRGKGSGHGKTCCRGAKGAKSRSGSETGVLFEGGQMPLARRIPKRGFTNIFKKHYNIINLDKLNKFSENEVVNLQKLKEMGVIKKLKDSIKILGNGEIKKPLNIIAQKFAKSAIEKIKTAGGKIEVTNEK